MLLLTFTLYIVMKCFSTNTLIVSRETVCSYQRLGFSFDKHIWGRSIGMWDVGDDTVNMWEVGDDTLKKCGIWIWEMTP